MSKSLGNFITVHDLLSKGVKGEVIRFALMSTRYNEPLDWSQKLLEDAEKVVNRLYRASQTQRAESRTGLPVGVALSMGDRNAEQVSNISKSILEALRDNLNTPKALALLQEIKDPVTLKASANFLGLLQQDADSWFKGDSAGEDTLWIEVQIEARNAAKKARDFGQADAIRNLLKEKGIILEDSAAGTTWRRG